jgi:nicotinamidase-related amidase
MSNPSTVTATDGQNEQHRKAFIGPSQNFWLHSTRTGFDLTHPLDPNKPSSSPTLTLRTTTSPITVSPSKSALVIIDMQNFFLSPSFGRSEGAGHIACSNLVKYAIPAARKAGIRIIWLNWGLTEEEVRNMPPAVKRAFGFEAVSETGKYGDGWEEAEDGYGVDKFGDIRYQGGHLLLENGNEGRVYRGLLMRDTWNAALYPPLDTIYLEGSKLPENPDVWIHKNRMSGMWGATTQCEEFLEKEGIKTLFFTGVNTDQCVGGTLTDSFSKGYDCVLLADGCGTSSPEYAQRCFEFNAARTFGFCLGCKEFAQGVEEMEK